MSAPPMVTFRREAPVVAEYDVVVCGGGPAGYIAAVASARAGARTALIEQNGFFGGLATAGLVAPVSEFNKNGRRVINGIPWEAMERLARIGGADLSYPIGNVPFDSELYKLVIQQMVTESGVTPYLCCTVTGCIQENHRIKHILCCGKTGEFALTAAEWIDCTGDAILCSAAGVPFQEMPQPEECQPATLCFRLGGVDTDHLEQIFLKLPNTKYANSRVRGILESLRGKEDVPVFGGPWFCWAMRDGIVHVNMTRSPVNLQDAAGASRMECSLREDVHQFIRLLQEYVPEFAHCYLLETAVSAGYREGKRICGSHILTGEEILSGYRFEDSIACAAHPVDIHRPADTSQDVTFLSQEGFIPYRSLYAEDFPNLLAAGRCLSADRQAFASVRVQAASMATGQAAGCAAALCAAQKLDVQKLSIHSLQELLKSQGAVF